MTGEHLRANFESWQAAAPDYVAAAEANWAAGEGAAWGIWGISEAQVGMLAELRPGMDAVELGCGTAYVSAWIARRGGRPVGVDQAPAQLATARRLQREHGLEFPLVEADAEAVPLPDASFDFAVSEYGASLWCEPRRWLAEAARLLRPGGVLAFLTSHPLSIMCLPDDRPHEARLVRGPDDIRRMRWPDDPGIEFHLMHGELIGLLRELGFEIEALAELRAPAGAKTRYEWADAEWCRRWPCEEAWTVRKR